MDYDGVGTSNGHWKVTIGNTSGITEGTASSTGSSGQRYATISDHSAMDNSADTKTIHIPLQVKILEELHLLLYNNKTL